MHPLTVLRWSVVATATSVCLLTCACVSKDEVARVASPDGAVEAILYEGNGGATTSFYYAVDLRTTNGWHRENVAHLYGAIRNDNAYGVNLRWVNDRQLRIEYLSARDETLLMPRVKMAEREVSVSLQNGIYDPSAPSGGMLYNLERSRVTQ